MLVRLPSSADDYAAVGEAARLADLFGATMVARFVQEAELADLAGLPCVRELRPFGGGWHPIDASQLTRQIERAAASARQRFHAAVAASPIAASFEVVTGSVLDAIGAAANPDDIIVVIEPQNPAERVTQQFSRLIDAAFQTPAAVMVVPGRFARRAGPIAAVMLRQDDPSIRSAIAIAATAKERVIALAPPGSKLHDAIAELAAGAGVQIEAGPCIPEPLDVQSLLAQMHHLKERLVVMSRGADTDKGAPMIASRRRIPVLVARAAAW
jgi:hypothetical protein